MKKLLYIPLDERPCNYDYPSFLSNITSDFEVLIPSMEILGEKKRAANVEQIENFILQHYENVDGIILSVDMLLYGGIVPSRLHNEEEKEVIKKLNIIKKIKKDCPKIKIFAYQLIMRCPSYSSDDEEPSYYQDYGSEIHNLGGLTHKEQIGIMTAPEKKRLQELTEQIPVLHLNDYLTRRQKNLNLLLETLTLVKQEIIDFLIVPQDDAAVYGYTQMEQQIIRKEIEKNDLELKVYMYPDADGVCNTLFTRFVNFFNHTKPKIFIRYNSTNGSGCIPFFEDRFVGETIKYHVIACGGLVASTLEEADMVAMINMVSSNMQSARIQFDRNQEYVVNRNLVEYIEYIDYLVNDLKKPVLIGDCAYSGGGDYQMFKLLRQKKLLFKVHSYSGWNTCSNALSTTFSLGIIRHYYGKNLNFYKFLALRYIDDVFYQGIVRQESNQKALNINGCSMWVYDGKRGTLAQFITKRLKYYIEKEFKNEEYLIELLDSFQPWNRSYETCLKIEIQKKIKEN